MSWLLALLLSTATDPPPPILRDVLERASARNYGVRTLRGKRVLMFGDSMVNCGINIYLEPWFKKHGAKAYVTRSWASSTTVTWSQSKKIDTYLWKFNPDIVLITLGSNELFHPYPKMKIRPIRGILKRLRPYRQVYWIGPPAWKKDKGIIRVMRSQLPPGHFLDSSRVRMGRQKDGYHPSNRGARQWAVAIWRWIKALLERRYPPPRGRP